MEEQKKRYTDEELEEFRQIILAKLELAKRDYQLLMDELTNKNDNGVDRIGSLQHFLNGGLQLFVDAIQGILGFVFYTII